MHQVQVLSLKWWPGEPSIKPLKLQTTITQRKSCLKLSRVETKVELSGMQTRRRPG